MSEDSYNEAGSIHEDKLIREQQCLSVFLPGVEWAMIFGWAVEVARSVPILFVRRMGAIADLQDLVGTTCP